jgi:transporter family-2 protein
MQDLWWVVLIGLIGGVAVGVQGPIAGAMGQRIGGMAGSLIVHVSGALLSGVLLFLRGGENLREWRSLPWYMLIAGVFGVILYQTINITLPRLGATTMVSLIIAGQLFAGAVIDQFGWLGVAQHPINLPRLAGMVILLLGAYLVTR